MTILGKKSRDITGETYGRLKAIERTSCGKNGNARWLCQCECGNESIVDVQSLINKHTQSCGCLLKDILTKHGKINTRLYGIWLNMKDRCRNPNFKQYEDYGGRGIAVCEEWSIDFKAFYNWSIENGYSDELTIDRCDNNGNYEPSNCRWTTRAEQSRNTRAHKDNKSGHKGVSWDTLNKNWRARIYVDGKNINLGSYLVIEDAIKTRKQAEKKYWGVV